MELTAARWYALRTRSRAERVVRDQLTSRGIESYLPLLKRVSQWKDRRKLIQWPLFPGYCFARISHEQKLLVLQAHGMVQIVGSANCPEPIPEEEMTAIIQVMKSTSHYEHIPYLEEGTWVEVIRGPFLGVRGKFVRRANQCRLVLSISLIRQAAAVEIDAADVAAVVPAPRQGSGYSLQVANSPV